MKNAGLAFAANYDSNAIKKSSTRDVFYHLMNIREIILILQKINTMIVMSMRRAFG